MKNFIKKLLLFLLLFFLVDKLFYWKVKTLPYREFDKRLERIMEGKMNKDILIFGSSRAQHNLYSDAMQDSLKMSTFNLGYRGCNINFQLFILKSVLKYNKKPKIIVLTVDDFREFLPEKTLQFRYDKLYPLVKYQEITKELICHKEISPFAVGLYCARMNWEQLLEPKSITKYDNWTKAGTIILDFTADDFDKKYKKTKEYDVEKELPDRLSAFKEFQNICKKEHIRLFVLVPPNYQIQNNVFIKRVNDLLVDKNTVFYSKIHPSFIDANYFSDASHLNKKGAILYTDEIIYLLKNQLNTNEIGPLF
ncbi:hypothetical protein [Flavobacterium sp. TAB 87]|uniref:hypothetical protein n=1 Tax=Flavobacterium sp. TAB 87 TaxID=1729581 RepID=UPI000B076500|nr:hypothetical protein [Flavobacterium sp. TAB 87]